MSLHRGILGSAVALGLLTFASASADQPPDLTKVDRRIAKEPKYTAKRPLYGLYVSDPGQRPGYGPYWTSRRRARTSTMCCTSTATRTAT